MISLRSATYELIISLRNIALEQRITNLIVCSQLSSDPQEKSQLVDEAKRRLAMHDPAQPARTPSTWAPPKRRAESPARVRRPRASSGEAAR